MRVVVKILFTTLHNDVMRGIMTLHRFISPLLMNFFTKCFRILKMLQMASKIDYFSASKGSLSLLLSFISTFLRPPRLPRSRLPSEATPSNLIVLKVCCGYRESNPGRLADSPTLYLLSYRCLLKKLSIFTKFILNNWLE